MRQTEPRVSHKSKQDKSMSYDFNILEKKGSAYNSSTRKCRKQKEKEILTAQSTARTAASGPRVLLQ